MNVLALAISSVHAGASLTSEVKNTSVILSKRMKSFDLIESQKIDFICLMTQMKARNSIIQNVLFNIDWNVLLTVSKINQ